MLCFVQGFSDRDSGYNKSREGENFVASDSANLGKKKRSKSSFRNSLNGEASGKNEVVLHRKDNIIAKSFRDTSNKVQVEVKRSFSDRFSVINDAGGRKVPKGFLTIRKTW
ncbi:jg12348 [Pararge aegeria aegeria]|uniref:Jg12348 protein n=1 Tax=Pararge aegeria aegeria TaxID=348720 RepID=A0A8S4R5V0_9NEOP|nr:jg12348 [Pararge aegeria aegeria]